MYKTPGEMISLNSSNLVGCRYDDGELVIDFQGGDQYAYSGVPPSVYDSLVSASSPGSFFHRQIKGQYPTKKLS